MNEIKLIFQCPNNCCEVLAEEPDSTRSFVKDLSLQALYTLFEVVHLGQVSVTFPLNHADREAPIIISIHAHCDRLLLPIDPANLDCAVEGHVAGALIEIFGTLDVDHAIVC